MERSTKGRHIVQMVYPLSSIVSSRLACFLSELRLELEVTASDTGDLSERLTGQILDRPLQQEDVQADRGHTFGYG